eukprot:scaffold448702_cov14-Prasinocladus_malaysianus.AAC.1
MANVNGANVIFVICFTMIPPGAFETGLTSYYEPLIVFPIEFRCCTLSCTIQPVLRMICGFAPLLTSGAVTLTAQAAM